MAEEKIEVVVVADDSGINESLQRQAQNFEKLAAEAKTTGKAIDESLKPRTVDDYGKSVKGTTKDLQNQSKQINKNTKSFTRFNKVGSKGLSVLSRFGGASSQATRQLGGLAFALSSSPFGAFAVAAGVASAAYSLFTKAIGEDTDEIIEKNNELRESITGLQSDLEAGFGEGRRLAIELEDISEAEKKIKRERLDLFLLGEKQQKLNEAVIVATEKQNKLETTAFKNETDRLKAKEESLQADLEANKAAQDLGKLQVRLIKDQERARKAAAQERARIKREEEELAKLLDGLIRDERQKRIKALQDEAARREKRAREIARNTEELNSFVEQSQNVLREDLLNLNNEFDQKERKARQSVLSQLIIDEQAAAEQAAQNAFEANEIAIQNLVATDEEKAALQKENTAKLEADLIAIRKQFADQRKQEAIDQENEILSIRETSLDAQEAKAKAELDKRIEIERQFLIDAKASEEDLTNFQEKQDEERLKLELSFQIKRLNLQKQFNKQLTDEQKAAIDAQITALGTQLAGVGQQVSGTTFAGLSEEAKNNATAIQGALEQGTTAVRDAVAERIALFDQEIAKRNDNISNLETSLSNELRLAELGKAANVREVKDQIAQEKAAREKAEKEKEEAAKAQFILDTALQTSNLVTAVSGLYSSLSSLPFGIGVALATALSAVMIGSFVASKAKAGQVAGFAEGGEYGYTGHGSKYSKSNALGERPYDYHKGEYIIPKDMTERLGLSGVPVSNVEAVLASNISDNTPNLAITAKKNKSIRKTIKQNNLANKQRIETGLKDAIKEQLPFLKQIANKPVAIVMPDGSTHVLQDGKKFIYRQENKKA